MSKQDFIEAVRAAGIVGEGGAGFPAHVKYAAEAETVIANGCECEPLLHTDQHVMRHESAALVRGLRALADAANAGRVVLALKAKHKELVAHLREAVANSGIELFLLDNFYPAGDEQVLAREITGQSVPPLGIPLQIKAMVANVGTLVKVDAALQGRPVTHKLMTVTGEVARPGVINAPLGASLAECLAACGGAVVKNPVFIAGGPMMGRFIGGPQELAGETVVKTGGGLIVLPSGHYLHRNAVLKKESMRRRSASACIQCRTCSDLCPRYLIGHPFETHKVMRAFGAGSELENADIAMLCCECGVCEHFACPMELSPRRINQAVKEVLRENGKKYEGTREIMAHNQEWRSYRKVPVERLASKIGIDRYMHLNTPYIGELAPVSVSVPLRQHIGGPAVPVVREGDALKCGDLLAEAPQTGLGARVHTGISGLVGKVDGSAIFINSSA